MSIITWLIVGLIAGALAGRFMRGRGYGIIGDIVVGVIGAFVGGWILSLVSLPTSGNVLYDIVVALVGAVVLIWLVRLFAGGATTV